VPTVAGSRCAQSDVSDTTAPRIGLEASALAVGVALLYASGACPTVYVGDSGELVTAAAMLGIPHPTGYPLYVLLGHLWTVLLPIGEPAWRMSLFSAACGGAAAGVFYAVIRHEGWPVIAALTGALLFAAAPSEWGEANVQVTCCGIIPMAPVEGIVARPRIVTGANPAGRRSDANGNVSALRANCDVSASCHAKGRENCNR